MPWVRRCAAGSVPGVRDVEEIKMFGYGLRQGADDEWIILLDGGGSLRVPTIDFPHYEGFMVMAADKRYIFVTAGHRTAPGKRLCRFYDLETREWVAETDGSVSGLGYFCRLPQREINAVFPVVFGLGFDGHSIAMWLHAAQTLSGNDRVAPLVPDDRLRPELGHGAFRAALRDDRGRILWHTITFGGRVICGYERVAHQIEAECSGDRLVALVLREDTEAEPPYDRTAFSNEVISLKLAAVLPPAFRACWYSLQATPNLQDSDRDRIRGLYREAITTRCDERATA